MSSGRKNVDFCIDIDNTVAQSDEVMRRVIAEVTRERVHLAYDDVVSFNYYECRDRNGNHITKEEWIQVHEVFSEPEYLRTILPIKGAVSGLAEVAKVANLHLVTTRLRKARQATAEWLDIHSFPVHDLHFVRPGEKHLVLKPFAAAVEDDYAQAVNFTSSGTSKCFLLLHPWNRSRPTVEGVKYVNSWSELTRQLVEVASP